MDERRHGGRSVPALVVYSQQMAGRSRAGRRSLAEMPVPRMYHTEAIVLSRFELGEADRVLTLLTPHDGKLKAIAKGVRRPRSRIGGAVEPFAELQLVLARGRTFDVITQASVGHAWLSLRDRLESTATAWYLAELSERAVEERAVAYPVYALLRRAYQLLDDGMAPGRVARWFEFGLADALGMRPEVERCVECDRVLEARRGVPLGAGPRWHRLRAPPAATGGADAAVPRRAQAAARLPAAGHRGHRRRCACRRRRGRGRGGPASVHSATCSSERHARCAFLDEVRAGPQVRVGELSDSPDGRSHGRQDRCRGKVLTIDRRRCRMALTIPSPGSIRRDPWTDVRSSFALASS